MEYIIVAFFTTDTFENRQLIADLERRISEVEKDLEVQFTTALAAE